MLQNLLFSSQICIEFALHSTTYDAWTAIPRPLFTHSLPLVEFFCVGDAGSGGATAVMAVVEDKKPNKSSFRRRK